MKNLILAFASVVVSVSLMGCASSMEEPKLPPSANAVEEPACDPNAPGYQLCVDHEQKKQAAAQASVAPPPPAAPPPVVAVPSAPPAPVAAPPQIAAAPPPSSPPVQFLPGMPAVNAVAPCSTAPYNLIEVSNSTDFAVGVYGLVQRLNGNVAPMPIEDRNGQRSVAWLIAPHGRATFCFIDASALPPQVQSGLPPTGDLRFITYALRGMFPAKVTGYVGGRTMQMRYNVPNREGQANTQDINMGVIKYF